MDCEALKGVLDDPLLVIKLHNSLYAGSNLFRPWFANLQRNYLPDDDIYFAIIATSSSDALFFFSFLSYPTECTRVLSISSYQREAVRWHNGGHVSVKEHIESNYEYE